MIKTTILILTIPFFLLCCKKQVVFNEIIIEGQVKNVPDGKVYLTESHKWRIYLDSTICTNGHFTFKLKTDSFFIPYMASIHFFDSSIATKSGSLFFRNYMFGADSAKHIGNAFYLEKGITRIEGDNENSPYLRVFAGKETDLLYKYQHTGFGYLSAANSVSRSRQIEYFKKKVEEHPYSYFFLQSIYNGRENYSEDKISELLALFNVDVQKSKLGEQFRTYLINRIDPNKPYPNLSLLNSDNQRHTIIDKNSNLNMLVFWASWCGPCRMEIPLLNELRNKYQAKRLNLVSISIDANASDWHKALKQEKMPWMQCIVDNDKIEMIKEQFNFSAIPLVVFTDKTGKEIARYAGYSRERKNEYETVIGKFIE